MSAQLAILICSAGVAGLFYLNRDNSVQNSKALWLPVIWISIAGSRPVSSWFGMGSGDTLAATLEGSPLDAAISGVLLLMGVVVLLHRRKKTTAYLALISPIILYSLYCAVSVTWAPYVGPAFKRWTKDLGDLVMVLLIATDAEPISAIRRLYSRIGFVLFPFSIVLIRYTDLGRYFDPDGGPMNTGVTTNKNSLGLIVFVISLGVLWNVRSLLMNKDEPNRARRLVAQGTLLAFGLALLAMAHSATSIACFILGSGIILATSLRAIRSRPARVHALCLGIFLAGGLAGVLGGQGAVVHSLGRGSTLSGRTLIWAALIPAAANPIFGVGFDSFWTSPSAVTFQRNLLNWYHVEGINEAHNGYIEIYLNLGFVGLALISLILTNGYRGAVTAFRRNPSIAGLMLAYIIASIFYSITEAGFRTLNPIWIFLLLAIVSARGVTAGLFSGKRSKIRSLKSDRKARTTGSDELSRSGAAVYSRRGLI
jgi:exopolysaccharide production protein ExoQ